MEGRYDVVVVGGGLVGLATAHQLLRRRPGVGVLVVEKEAEVALHQSGRNSGVVHSGLYYRPGSLKARLCREGKAALEAFAGEHGIPYERRGKVIVAVEEREVGRLRDLLERGRANGVEGLEEIGQERLRELEPHARGVRALHSPETGVVDFRRVALALADEVRAAGGGVALRCRVTGARREDGWAVETTRGVVRTRGLIGCAGLQSDRVAAMTGARSDQRIVPFRGDFYRLAPEGEGLVRGLIYSVPDPTLPFLGFHFTRRVDGEVWAGPNAVLAFAREGYGRWSLRPADLGATLAYPGFWRLARRHWRAGLEELRRDLVKSAFVEQCRRYLPELRAEHLIPAPPGIRAQTVAREGTLVDDFSLQEAPGVIQVRNAPSPAATACLAIGRVLAERAVERFGLG